MSEDDKNPENDQAPARSHDEYEVFLVHFTRDRERLAAYLYSLLPNQADAEDVFQRCSLLLWRKFSEFDPDRNFLSWACGIGFNEVRNFLRSAQRNRLHFNSELMSQISDRRLHGVNRSVDLLPVLRHCLEALPAAEAELIQIAYEPGETIKEFAESRGQALQTLYNRLSRIRRLLLNCVQSKLAME